MGGGTSSYVPSNIHDDRSSHDHDLNMQDYHEYLARFNALDVDVRDPVPAVRERERERERERPILSEDSSLKEWLIDAGLDHQTSSNLTEFLQQKSIFSPIQFAFEWSTDSNLIVDIVSTRLLNGDDVSRLLATDLFRDCLTYTSTSATSGPRRQSGTVGAGIIPEYRQFPSSFPMLTNAEFEALHEATYEQLPFLMEEKQQPQPQRLRHIANETRDEMMAILESALSLSSSTSTSGGELPPFSLTAPEFDLSHFLGRLRFFMKITNPLTLLTQDEEIKQSKRMLDLVQQVCDNVDAVIWLVFPQLISFYLIYSSYNQIDRFELVRKNE